MGDTRARNAAVSVQHTDVIYVAFAKRVVALDRRTGDVCWTWKPKKCPGTYPSLLLEKDTLIVSLSGYMWALNPLTGEELWHNPLKGIGVGVSTMVSATNPGERSATRAVAAAEAQQAAS